jgi:hypothetical protein
LFFGLPAFESPNHTRKESKVKVFRFFCILIAGKSFDPNARENQKKKKKKKKKKQ